jgi:large subunit ribosomal protein L35
MGIGASLFTRFPQIAASPSPEPARLVYTQEVVQNTVFVRNTMPKLKTHSGAAKRFHKTGTGKFKRGQSKMRHILTSKATKTKRHLGGSVLVSEADSAKVARMIPYA